MSGSDTNALAASLGSIIGYVGAEVAEPSLFERLLWPRRFYNYVTPVITLKTALLNPMGGPLHKAAMKTLDKFRSKGLYKGMRQGHMLGTAFYANLGLRYTFDNYKGSDRDNEVRNGLWITVLQYASHIRVKHKATAVEQLDTESSGGQPAIVKRTSQIVQHLKLSIITKEFAERENLRIFSEESLSWQIVFSLVASETTAFICAGVMIYEFGSYVFAAYLLTPLVLKALAVVVSVRREPLDVPSTKDSTDNILVQISDYDHGFPLIEGPENIVRPFFRHWGHPIRQTHADRLREVTGIALVVAFVFFFPIGLLSMLWVSQPVQVMWLSYQMYTIIAMHITRFRGDEGEGRIEEGIAKALCSGKPVVLHTRACGYIMATLDRENVERIADGHEKVKQIVLKHSGSSEHQEKMLEARNL